jgi:hypothetical protein
VLALDRVINPNQVVHEDEFCAFLPSDQRPTQLVVANAHAFACVSWDGSALIVGSSGGSHAPWAALRYIPALFLHSDSGRLSPPSFVIPLAQEQLLVAHGQYVDVARIPGNDVVIGAVGWTQSRFLILERSYCLRVGFVSCTLATDWVCSQLR